MPQGASTAGGCAPDGAADTYDPDAWLRPYQARYVQSRRDAEARLPRGGAVDLVVPVAFRPAGARRRRGAATPSPHPYIPHLPSHLQQRFHPRRMLRDLREEPSFRSDAALHASGASYLEYGIRDLDLEAMARSVGDALQRRDVTAYVLPYIAQPRAQKRGMHGVELLGRVLYFQIVRFIQELGGRRMRLSFIGVGVGGLVVRAALRWFHDPRSELALSGVAVDIAGYVSVGTPHLGVRRGPALGNAWKSMRHWLLVRAWHLVGAEVLLEDGDFALMTLALHDKQDGLAWEAVRKRVLLAVEHDRFCARASAMNIADASLTPLGKYITMCKRTGEALPDDTAALLPEAPKIIHIPCPSRGPTDRVYRILAPTLLHGKHLSVETLFGPPAAAVACYTALAYYRRYHLPVVLFESVTLLAALEFVVMTLGFVLFLWSGYIYHSSLQPDTSALEDRFAYMGDPFACHAYYRTARRVYRPAASDAHAEVCVNVLKEVLNTDEAPGGVVRAVVAPEAPRAWRVLRDPHGAVESPAMLGYAAEHLEFDVAGGGN